MGVGARRLAAYGYGSSDSYICKNTYSYYTYGRAWRVVAYFSIALHHGQSNPAAAILAAQWVLEVAGMRYASARTEGYLLHLPAAVVGRLVGLCPAAVAEGAGQDAHSYLSELLDLHQSLHWEAAWPYLACGVGREEGEAPRASVHCDTRLVAGRIGL